MPAAIDVEAFAYVECAAPSVFVFEVKGESHKPMPTSPHRPPSHTPLFRHHTNVPVSTPPAGLIPPAWTAISAWNPMWRSLPRSQRPRTPMTDPTACVREAHWLVHVRRGGVRDVAAADVTAADRAAARAGKRRAVGIGALRRAAPARGSACRRSARCSLAPAPPRGRQEPSRLPLPLLAFAWFLPLKPNTRKGRPRAGDGALPVILHADRC